jgi:hypothetical protein
VLPSGHLHHYRHAQFGGAEWGVLFVLLLAVAVAGFVLFIRNNPPVSFEADVPSPAGASSSDRIDDFQRLPKPDRISRLAHMVSDKGQTCTPTKAIYKGKDEDGSAYYALRCANGASWMVTLVNNPEGSTLVTSCETMEEVGGDCFETWK